MPDGELGCADDYRALIHFQGGESVWTPVEGLTALSWSRKLDDYSEASITVGKQQAGPECCGRLGRTQAWAHELSIYRDRELVWQGPIVRVDETKTAFTVNARDVIAWLDRRAIHPRGPTSLPAWRWHYFWWQPRPAGEIARKVLVDAFTAPYPDPGVWAYARVDVAGTPRATTELMYGDEEYVGTLLRDLLDVGMDMFTLGRRLYVIPEDYRVNRAPYRLTERHFAGELTVRKNGLDTATRGILVGGDVLDGEGNPMPNFPPAVAGQPELEYPPVRGAAGWNAGETGYGLVERISTSDGTNDQAVATGIAARVRAYGFPPPVSVLVPDGAQLEPTAPVSIGQLVPGRAFHVGLSEQYCTPISGGFRLNEVEVEWTADSAETVAVSLASMTNPPVEGGDSTP